MINDSRFEDLLLTVNELDSEQLETLYDKAMETLNAHRIVNAQTRWNTVQDLMKEIAEIFPKAWISYDWRVKDFLESTFAEPDWLVSENE